MNSLVKAYVLPGLPHILLTPEKNPGWKTLNESFKAVRRELEEAGVERLVIYSTYWASVIGHQIQARPEPKWIHVDDQFHDLGSMPYHFKVDVEFSKTYDQACKKRGLHSRLIDYDGFPIDTGTVVVQKLLNPDNRFEVSVVSSNVYSDRAETVILGKAARDAILNSAEQKKTAAIAISSLSNRLFTKFVDAKDDALNSLKDQEWNDKYLELLKEGRLEDCAQLSRQFHSEARVKKVSNFKPFWWLSSVMGSTNNYAGQIYAYEAVMGTGAAVVSLTPAKSEASDLEYDENDTEVFYGDRQVLDNPEKAEQRKSKQKISPPRVPES